MTRSRGSLSRRRALKAGLAAASAFVAGCSERASSTEPPSTPEPPARSVFEGVSFDGGDLVVRLKDGHEITRINLIAPDGSLFEQASVAEGATTVRLPILDIKPYGGGYEHYTPGRHEIVAVSEAGSESMEIELEPELRIVDVRQYREGGEANDYGQLAVVVENVGTAPTWVYDVKNQRAPNFAANVPLGDDPGVLHFEFPEDPKKAIIPPDEKRTYVGVTSPFLFVSQNDPNCTGKSEMSVLVGTAIGDPLEQPIRATVEGNIKSVGLIGEYVCTNISVELIK